MLSIDRYEKNILNTLGNANQTEINLGVAWYADTYKFAQDLAHKAGLPVYIVVGVIAVLSPRVHWSRNRKLAEIACLFGTQFLSGVFGTSKRKASDILNEGLHPLDVINGAPKTKAFYECIMSSGDSDQVCCDVWHKRVCYGTNNIDPHITPKDYNLMSIATQNVARYKGMKPAQLQAVVWIVKQNDKQLALM